MVSTYASYAAGSTIAIPSSQPPVLKPPTSAAERICNLAEPPLATGSSPSPANRVRTSREGEAGWHALRLERVENQRQGPIVCLRAVDLPIPIDGGAGWVRDDAGCWSLRVLRVCVAGPGLRYHTS